MSRKVFAELDNETFRRCRRIKDWNEMTWADVVEHGVANLPAPGEAEPPEQ